MEGKIGRRKVETVTNQHQSQSRRLKVVLDGRLGSYVERMLKSEEADECNIPTRHMNMPMDQSVYINKALPLSRPRLLRLARQFNKDKQYRFRGAANFFCWKWNLRP
ncbi:hypothetical protein J6590_082856 [Homalodisca vitripennis]|nr:hypothetical protein J6590_082856 [Homalodisca vitripennis]